MRIFLLVLHLLLTLVMIGVILIQRGEDANAGSSSGYGAIPGARSGKSVLTRLTSILAAIFFANCVGMAILVRKQSKLMVDSTTKNSDPTTAIKGGSIKTIKNSEPISAAEPVTTKKSHVSENLEPIKVNPAVSRSIDRPKK